MASEPSLRFRASIPVIDANVGVGHRHDRPAPFDTPAQLLAEMDRHGVDRAIVYHVQGEVISPVSANQDLEHWVGGESRLEAQWVLGPRDDSLDQVQDLCRLTPSSSVRLMDAGSAQIPVTPWVFGPALEWLQSSRVPLWISLADNPVTEVVDTLSQFPDLDVLLLGAHYTHASVVRPLLRHLPRARLELSRYEGLGEVEALVSEFGARRLVYGSYYPRYAMGPVLHALHELDLTEEDLRALCAGSLVALLEGGP
jgi:hypothetical protein